MSGRFEWVLTFCIGDRGGNPSTFLNQSISSGILSETSYVTFQNEAALASTLDVLMDFQILIDTRKHYPTNILSQSTSAP